MPVLQTVQQQLLIKFGLGWAGLGWTGRFRIILHIFPGLIREIVQKLLHESEAWFSLLSGYHHLSLIYVIFFFPSCPPFSAKGEINLRGCFHAPLFMSRRRDVFSPSGLFVHTITQQSRSV